MLTAALAVGVPGCLLSLTGCGGQASAQAGQARSGQAQAGQAQSGQTQADAEARAAEQTQAQRVQVRKKSSKLAMTLLTESAEEGVRQTYQGEEIVLGWDSGGGVTALDTTVYHESGGATFTLTQAAGVSQPFTSPDLDDQSPEGVLGVTAPLVQLLETNYILSYTGTATAGGRPAQVVKAKRDDGTLAAEFWLDAATKLPLERKVYDSTSQLVSVGTFTYVKIGLSASKPVFVPDVQPSSAFVWSYPIAPQQLLAFTRQGWIVPSALPGGLTLFTGGETQTPTGQVLDLAYSDGLYVVSVFEQHGKLAAKLAGWQKTKVGGQVVYAAVPDQRSFTWSGKDVVYTLIADAPPQTVADVVGKLPHDEPPGFWKRISRGLSRMAHAVNPFG
jgi:sigma-E factor negative regulatory protein RseB